MCYHFGMDSFEKKRRWRNFTHSKITLFVLLTVLLVVGRSTWGLYAKSKEASVKRERLEKESKDLENRLVFLQEELASLKTEEGVERTLKQKFNIKKEGEEVVVIIDGNNTDEKAGSGAKKSWLGAFFGAITDIFR